MGAHHHARPPVAAATSHPSPLALQALRRHPPEVGARCLNRARRVLCGGRTVTCAPTATGPARLREDLVEGGYRSLRSILVVPYAAGHGEEVGAGRHDRPAVGDGD